MLSGTSSLEGLVDGSEPAHVGAGGEEDEPQEGHAEVGRPATSTHPRQTANEIYSQRGAIHCQHHREGARMTETRTTEHKTVPQAALLIIQQD